MSQHQSLRDHVRPRGKLSHKHGPCAEACRIQNTSDTPWWARGQPALEDVNMTSVHTRCCGPAGQDNRDHILNWFTATT